MSLVESQQSTTFSRPSDNQMIDGERHEGDAKTQGDALAQRRFGQGLEDRLAEVNGADECCDDHHRKGKHDGLVDAEHDMRQGHGQLKLQQSLPFVAPCHGDRFMQFRPSTV